MKILKFGGSSVSTDERINNIIDIIINTKKTEPEIHVVVSAFGGTTDKLIETARLAEKGDKKYQDSLKQISQRHLETAQSLNIPNKKMEFINESLSELKDLLNGIYLIKELSPKTMDLIMSFGERLSAYTISEAIRARDIKVSYLDTRKLIKTNNNFNNAKIDKKATYENLANYFKSHKELNIITGFISSTNSEETTTLGRGGSDFTASIIGAALNAKEVQIWTDVDGVMTADPRKVKKSFPINNLTYREAMELSHFGAKVIYPPTMQPVLDKNIPIRIKNTFNPSSPGSLINNEKSSNGFPAKGISSIDKIALLRVQGSGLIGVTGISKRLFGSLAEAKINIILISQASSEHSICFAIAPEDSKKAREAIEKEFELEIQANLIDPVVIEEELSIIAVIGENMKQSVGVSGQLFQALAINGINVIAIAQGSSELNISVVIAKKDEVKALNAIHDNFFLSETKSLNLFIVGTGLIGSTLIKQIQNQYPQIKNDLALELNIIALANSKHMLFNEDGINLETFETQLSKSKSKMDIKAFITKMKDLNLPNSVFIDATATESVPLEYESILNSSISIVTPNKKANSSNIRQYLKLSQAAAKSNAKFLYETNVGAGLPIIQTIQDFENTGDKILKIEAVLSGTLSYIFNSFNGNKKFSEVVNEAAAKGYTEPDPRDDLNGLDVARKLLILARETGLLMEMSDIQIQNLVPESLRKTQSIKEFFEKLKLEDPHFEKLKKDAESKNQKLCYIAKLEGKKTSIKLEAVDSNHPFYSLSGSDNIVSITSERYKANPLVIKGPGAGAEVTAAGVFTDILRIANVSLNTKTSKFSFLEKLKKNKLTISLIGMSNIGKTFWSKKLTNLGFKHINCDDIIEAKLKKILAHRESKGLKKKGIQEMAKWLGQPYDDRFKKNQEIYLELEKETMEEILKQIEDPKENIVLDTTGSIIYTGDQLLSKLKNHSLVVYIESTAEMKQKMYENFTKHPKPIIWGDSYKKEKTESNENALKNSYMELLDFRAQNYQKCADVSIPYSKIKGAKESENQFLNLIQEKL